MQKSVVQIMNGDSKKTCTTRINRSSRIIHVLRITYYESHFYDYNQFYRSANQLMYVNYLELSKYSVILLIYINKIMITTKLYLYNDMRLIIFINSLWVISLFNFHNMILSHIKWLYLINGYRVKLKSTVFAINLQSKTVAKGEGEEEIQYNMYSQSDEKQKWSLYNQAIL